MTIKSMVSKELESTVGKITSEFQNQLNTQLTQLIAKTIENAETHKASSNESKNAKTALSTKEIEELKNKLIDEKTASATQKQKFQVELTQLKINHAESMETLGYQIEDLKAEQLEGKDDSSKLSILEADKLKVQLSKSVNALDQAKQRLTILEGNTKLLEERDTKIASLNVQLSQAGENLAKSKDNEAKLVAIAIKEAESKYSDMIGKLQQEQTINAESKLKETSQQQLIDIQQQQLKDHVNAENLLKKQVVELTKNAELSEKAQAEKEQASKATHEKNTVELREQLKVSVQENESTLARFNMNKDKQEQENIMVRNTIKNLRDENNELNAQQTVQSESFNEKINLLEQKVTEYRLKFEYAQKQINQTTS